MQHVKTTPKLSHTKKASARLTPSELRHLADQMVASKDPAKIARLKRALEQGFYGDKTHA
jgi:hypothetical protein